MVIESATPLKETEAEVSSAFLRVHGRCRLRIQEEMLKVKVFNNVTLERAQHVLTASLHHITALLILTSQCLEEADFVVKVSMQTGDSLHLLASYGSCDVPAKAKMQDTVCSNNECFLMISDLCSDERTRNLDVVRKRGMRSYVGERVHELYLCFLSKVELHSTTLSQLSASFSFIAQHLRESLSDMDNSLRSQRIRDEAERARNLCELEIRANRFLRHELKNSLVGAISDLAAVRDSIAHNIPAEHPDPVIPLLQPSPPCDCSPSTPRQGFSLRRMSSAVPSDTDTGVMTSAVRDIDVVILELRATTDRILSSSMIHEVLEGRYVPRIDEVDVAQLCASYTVPAGLVVKPSTFNLATDGQLLRHIVENAISNAEKYGAKASPLEVVIERQSETLVSLAVVNKPGPGHEKLMALEDPNVVFQPGERFHEEDAAPTHHVVSRSGHFSAGDGAWIMRQCATALGGNCCMIFRDNETRFELVFPAERIDHLDNNTSVDEPSRLLAASFAVALDDAASQRRQLRRLLKGIGIVRTKFFGDSADSVKNFVDTVADLVADSEKETRFVFFLDDNLAYKATDGVMTFSGVALGEELLRRLEASHNSDRCLLLARTANDDPVEIASYAERVHAHFPKCFMSQQMFNAALLRLWRARFDPEDKAKFPLKHTT